MKRLETQIQLKRLEKSRLETHLDEMFCLLEKFFEKSRDTFGTQPLSKFKEKRQNCNRVKEEKHDEKDDRIILNFQ